MDLLDSKRNNLGLSLPQPSTKVLIVQPLPGIGDMIWHLPHIHSIAARTPGGAVSVLTKPRSMADQLFKTDPTVAGILWLRRNPGEHSGWLGILRLARQLREHRFTEAWLFHNSPRYALACWLAGIPQRIGYGGMASRVLLSHCIKLSPAEQAGHPIDKATALLRQMDIPVVEASPTFCISDETRASIERRFCSLPRPWIAFGIGSSEVYKQWGAGNFIALARALALTTPVSLLLVGGQAEQAMAATIIDELSEAGITAHAIIAEPLDRIAALLACCDLYIGNDTGMLNLAAAAGTKAIGLFCGRHPVLNYSPLLYAVVASDKEQGMASIRVASVMEYLRSAQLLRVPTSPYGSASLA